MLTINQEKENFWRSLEARDRLNANKINLKEFLQSINLEYFNNLDISARIEYRYGSMDIRHIIFYVPEENNYTGDEIRKLNFMYYLHYFCTVLFVKYNDFPVNAKILSLADYNLLNPQQLIKYFQEKL